MQTFISLLNFVQEWIWTYFGFTILIVCALYFSVKTKFVQVRLLPEMVRLMFFTDIKNENKSDNSATISPFQAFIVSLSSRVGIGSIAGVATAISVGGPGAVFWMWLMAFFGSALAVVESSLSQLYKRRGKSNYFGGPAYYILYGLRKRWLSILFSILIILDIAFFANSAQSNTIALAFSAAFDLPKYITGIMLFLLVGFAIFGGIHRIAKITETIVPTMVILYLAVALYIIVNHIDKSLLVFYIILSNAFGIGEFAAGSLGTIILMGIKRSLFCNEAGEGTAPHAAATSETSHPLKQGLIQALGVFISSFIVCSCTAFIILFSGVDFHQYNGIELVQMAISKDVGLLGKEFIAIIIFLCAFGTIITYYFYGESNVLFLLKTNANSDNKTMNNSEKFALYSYRFIVLFFVLLGTLMSLELTWLLLDFFMALLTICNLFALLLLSKQFLFIFDDYIQQIKHGHNPVFHKNKMPKISKFLDAWKQ